MRYNEPPRSPERLWMDTLPVTVMLYGPWLLPGTLGVAGPETTEFIAETLQAAQAVRPEDGRQAIVTDALERVRVRLNAEGRRAASDVLAYIANAAVEIARPSIERLQADEKASAERHRARALLAVVLRAWGVSGEDVEDVLRFDTKNPVPDPPRARRPASLIQVMPMVENHPAMGRLRYAWSSWTATAPWLCDETLLRVLAVLNVVVLAWNAHDFTTLRGGGEAASTQLRRSDPFPFLLANTEKARAMHATLVPVLVGIHHEAIDDLDTPKRLRGRLDGWCSSANQTLAALVAEFFPWWTTKATRLPMTVVQGGLEKDLRDLRRDFRANIPNDQLRARSDALATARVQPLVCAVLRAAGMTAAQVDGLFPRPRRRRPTWTARR